MLDFATDSKQLQLEQDVRSGECGAAAPPRQHVQPGTWPQGHGSMRKLATISSGPSVLCLVTVST